MIAARDEAVIAAQLGRRPRGLLGVAHRCPCGLPDVAETAPRLPDGTPFPTLYYLTCPKAAAAIGSLEASGMMREMTGRLARDDSLRDAYRAAHQDYLARRDEAARLAGVRPLPPGTQSAGGMPQRVKCLHALAAHELATHQNPFGREALDAIGEWWANGPCVSAVNQTVAVTEIPTDHSGSQRRAERASRSPGCGGSEGASRPGEAVTASNPRTEGGSGGCGLHPPENRVAAIDCGTNSLRLLVADVGDGELADVVRRMEIVRLGQGVDKTGRLAPEALHRMTVVLRDYARAIAQTGAGPIRMVATSATRDAENSAEFVHRVKDVLGIAPEVLTGDAEARLSFTGATAELLRSGAGTRPPYLVADIGGGSTEFVLGGPGLEVRALSVDIGCVRLTERHLHDDPPSDEQIAAAMTDIDAALDAVAAHVPVRQARTLIGLAGSVATVAGIALDLAEYDSARIHHAKVPAARVHEITSALLAQTRARRAAIGVMHPGRVDVIGGGALILDRIMRRFGFGEVLASEHDILDGIAWSLAREG